MQALLKSLPVLLELNDVPEMRQAVAIAVWPLAVGEKLKEHSKPLRLTERILMVAVPDARWKSEFEHHAPQIVYKLNAAAGRSIIARIHCLVDAAAFKGVRNASAKNETATEPVDLKVLKAAESIADTDLRKHFIAAATGSMNQS
jgi:hypothetical protein